MKNTCAKTSSVTICKGVIVVMLMRFYLCGIKPFTRKQGREPNDKGEKVSSYRQQPVVSLCVAKTLILERIYDLEVTVKRHQRDKERRTEHR